MGNAKQCEMETQKEAKVSLEGRTIIISIMRSF